MDMSKNLPNPLTPPERLALAYAEPRLRDVLQWLLEFHHRLSSAVNGKSDPIMAQMRLAWWREQLSAPAQMRAKGEPLLAQLPHSDVMTPTMTSIALQMVDEWEFAALQSANGTAVRPKRSALFQGYCDWAGVAMRDDADMLAGIWLGWSNDFPDKRLPRIIRPLSILALSEILKRKQEEASAFKRMILPFRLLWHSLTGS